MCVGLRVHIITLQIWVLNDDSLDGNAFTIYIYNYIHYTHNKTHKHIHILLNYKIYVIMHFCFLSINNLFIEWFFFVYNIRVGLRVCHILEDILRFFHCSSVLKKVSKYVNIKGWISVLNECKKKYLYFGIFFLIKNYFNDNLYLIVYSTVRWLNIG